LELPFVFPSWHILLTTVARVSSVGGQKPFLMCEFIYSRMMAMSQEIQNTSLTDQDVRQLWTP
jgi:hypothetical protein